MKAVRFHQFGGPEILIYEDAPLPVAGAGEVIVQVKACALNHLDLWTRGGIPTYHINLPHIPGCDVAGMIDHVGEGVTGFIKGDKVLIAPGLSCFRCPSCLAGRDNLCEHYRIFGAGCDGGYAEFTKAPASNLIPIPNEISYNEAAAFPLTFLTAWHMLIKRAGLQPGQDLLVLAGGSGVGSAAIQIGKLAGARVIATAGTEGKLDQALMIGADFVIDHSRDDFSEEVLRITDGRGVDVVFEHIGPATFDWSLRALAKGGTLVTCGATSGPRVDLDLRYVFSRELTLMGALMGTRAELLEITHLVGEKKLRPIIDSVHPLSEARILQEKMGSRDLFGKLILAPGPGG
ncbi:MAG TPA: alcohol dehydrogenase [Nitrospiria bacterium]|nr:alcohol dehydrogenase [Candidatus Manganitrophaceae bacterium]HIL35836.1 alcohol dehydrogenase [Candidatus Manganitrophaceae bacterium]